MTITPQQFVILTEMGIDLWQRKKVNNIRIATTQQKQDISSTSSDNISINLERLVSESIFKDILHCLKLTSDQVIHTTQGLQLASFTWEFSDKNNIIVNKQKLTTPPLSDIAKSSQLKRQLWQAFQELNPC